MKKVTAYIHSHWDREWYREFDEFRLRLIEVFDEVLESLQKDEIPFFYFDGQTAAIEDYLEIRPEKLSLIKQFIEGKKLRIGPFYCSSDSFLVSGECLYRNFEIGIKKSRELGETEFIGYLADTFGHSRGIIYILKALGIDKACLWRGLGDLNADLDWEGIKVTNLIQGYFQDFLNQNTPIEKKAELLKRYIDKISAKSSEYVLLPIGADHLGISKDLKSQVNQLNKIYKDYNIEIKTPFEYFEKIRNRQNVNGEFLCNDLNFILPGVYSSRIHIKQQNACCQWALTRIAEPLNAIASHFYGAKNKQSELDYAYKTLIKNHAHDSIYGCCIDSTADEIMIRFNKVKSIANGVIKRTIRDISSKDAPLSVINLSNFSYNGKVSIITDRKLPKWLNAVKISSFTGFTDEKLYNTNEIPITEDYTKLNEYLIDVQNIPAFSLKHITKENVCYDVYLKTNKNSIENSCLKIEVKNGCINITDKKRNETYSDFISITDLADIGDSYNFGPLKGDNPVKACIKSYKIEESNNIRAVLNVLYEINIPSSSTKKGRTKTTYKHRINTDIILYNQSEYIEFCLKWQNKSKNHILKAGFNLKKKIFSTINEDLYGTTIRNFNPDFNIYDLIPAQRGKEIKPNTSPMQRFMIANDFGLITKGESEYEINKNTVNLTLLRSTGIISNPENPARGTPAGPPLPTPKLQCIGENSANLAITFAKKETQMFKLAEEFYNPCLCLFSNCHEKTFFNFGTNLVYAVKSEQNDLNVRTFDNNKRLIRNISIT